MIMIKLNIPMPTSCDSCPFKGVKWCYIAIWLEEMSYKEIPEEGRAEWCPMEDVSQQEDEVSDLHY